MKKLIALDMDRFLNNFDVAWERAFKKKFSGVPYIPISQMHVWDFSVIYPEIPKEAFAEIWQEKGFFANIDPMPGAQDVVRELQKSNQYGLAVLSYIKFSKYYWQVVKEKQEYLDQYFPGLVLYPVEDKTLIPYDLLIDDKPKILTVSEGIRHPYWMYAQYVHEPSVYNERYSLTERGHVFANGWSDVPKKIEIALEMKHSGRLYTHRERYH